MKILGSFVVSETALLSESVLKRDWLTEEEDEIWKEVFKNSRSTTVSEDKTIDTFFRNKAKTIPLDENLRKIRGER